MTRLVPAGREIFRRLVAVARSFVTSAFLYVGRCCGYRVKPVFSERLGTLAAGHSFLCLCKERNHRAHTLFVRRPLRGRSPAGRVCSGSRRGDIEVAAPLNGPSMARCPLRAHTHPAPSQGNPEKQQQHQKQQPKPFAP